MLNTVIYNLLLEIQNDAFQNLNHQAFYVELNNKNLKGRYGDWEAVPKGANKIRIFHIDRPTSLIIKTSIHELAHNIEYTIYKKAGHQKEFYSVYKKLIESAISLGIFNYEDALKEHDVQMLIKYHGGIEVRECINKYKNDSCIIKIFNSYEIKDTLSAIGFSFNKLEKSWDKEILKNQIEELKNDLLNLTTEDNIKIVEFSNLDIDVPKYIIISGNTFPYKEIIKELNYYYKDKTWVKKVLSSEINQEIEIIKNENLEGIDIGIALIR